MSEAQGLQEDTIGHYFSRWQHAAVANDLAAMLEMIADDAVFLVAGREPFGKQEFARMQSGAQPWRLEFDSSIGDLTVHGDIAFAWCRLAVSVKPQRDAETLQRRGHTLSVFRRDADGQWRLLRDANLLSRVAG
ncbi:MAG: SgcJ/EcaC family oxidoreductase [Rudaea sp.]